MMAQFYDRQDTDNLLNGTWIHDSLELRRLLGDLRSRIPFFAELIGENGFKLLLGVGSPSSCVQFSPADGSTPYLMAASDKITDEEGEIEFLIGDTASPVPGRYLLPYDTMVDIAAHFIDSGSRFPFVNWEEI